MSKRYNKLDYPESFPHNVMLQEQGANLKLGNIYNFKRETVMWPIERNAYKEYLYQRKLDSYVEVSITRIVVF